MSIKIHMTEPPRENPQFDKESLETLFCETLLEMMGMFDTCPIKASELGEGLYLKFAGRYFKFKVDIQLEHEVKEEHLPPDVYHGY